MPSILKYFDVVGFHEDKTKTYDFNPYSLFHLDGDLDINKPNYRNLFNKYPTISVLVWGAPSDVVGGTLNLWGPQLRWGGPHRKSKLVVNLKHEVYLKKIFERTKIIP
jgi:hypothetical protein